MRILIANRGEIARRIIRSAHDLGHETVAIYAEPDAEAPYVAEATMAMPIGPAALGESYLSLERVLAAAQRARVDAIHPGYGFLAENATFAQACIAQGLVWIGPNPKVIAAMGSKIEARKIAEQVGVPTIPGWAQSQAPGELKQAAAQIGYPVLIKASAGGGGKGIRIATSPAEFDNARSEAATEAERSFGDGRVIVERYIERPRHIEVQVFGDKHGAVAELGTRECSVQRRYQKLFEEAPAPNLSTETRTGLRTAARNLAKAIGYDSAGTVEFIVDDETGEFFFLEMNTRLQVEHAVTEAITGLDLVAMMIRVATGEELPLDAAQLRFDGHAIEARILAEDPAQGFAPQVGVIHQVAVPDGVRWDSAIEVGSEITPYYDSMIAKLVVHAGTRAAAMDRLGHALDHLLIDGVATTAGLHRWLLSQKAVVDATVTTRFLDETPRPDATPNEVRVLAAAARAWAAAQAQTSPKSSPWLGTAISLTTYEARRSFGLVDATGQLHELELRLDDLAESPNYPSPVTSVDLLSRRVAVNIDGVTESFHMPTRTERWIADAGNRVASGDAIVAPFPAVVSEVLVTAGSAVEGDQPLVVIEAMKMLHPLKSTGVATVDEVRVSPGDQIATGDILVTFHQPPQE